MSRRDYERLGAGDSDWMKVVSYRPQIAFSRSVHKTLRLAGLSVPLAGFMDLDEVSTALLLSETPEAGYCQVNLG